MEDGIRDCCRSRGLGDVYKRQVNTLQSLISLVVSVDAKHDVYFNTPSPSLISLVVSVDVKHHVYL